MFRRIALTLVTAAAAGIVGASTAAAHAADLDGGAGGSNQAAHAHASSDEYLNLGGPYGITYAEKKTLHFSIEQGWYYAG
ncbi:hypothetical protein [uncultured Streptomyces sp.]|uniref:hypothetical protein n=1 Tax=uncultured Streptomyces sp. TaxID=174707 RepID=UPI0026075813|nr:hypothetical protein [uncultured Streptomyces sp.]